MSYPFFKDEGPSSGVTEAGIEGVDKEAESGATEDDDLDDDEIEEENIADDEEQIDYAEYKGEDEDENENEEEEEEEYDDVDRLEDLWIDLEDKDVDDVGQGEDDGDDHDG